MGGTEAAPADDFMFVSRMLLDVDDLDPFVAACYLDMLNDLDSSWPLAAMAAAFDPLKLLPQPARDEAVLGLLYDPVNDGWLTSAKDVLKLWYSGQLQRRGGPKAPYVPAPPTAFVGALVWPMMGAQAQGVPGPFFGHWSYPPAEGLQ